MINVSRHVPLNDPANIRRASNDIRGLCDWSLAMCNTMMESVMERDKYRRLVRLVTCNIHTIIGSVI